MRIAKTPERVSAFLKELTEKLQVLKKNEIDLFLEYKKEEVWAPLFPSELGMTSKFQGNFLSFFTL